MSDIEYEPYPAADGPVVPVPDGGLQPPVAGWNRLAVWSFVIPLIVFVGGFLVGELFELVATGGGSRVAGFGALVVFLIVGTVVEVAAQAVGAVLGHRALRPMYAALRGRGLAVAGLVLNYLGLAWTVLSFVLAAVALVYLGSMYT